jgi:hypothetical protein
LFTRIPFGCSKLCAAGCDGCLNDGLRFIECGAKGWLFIGWQSAKIAHQACKAPSFSSEVERIELGQVCGVGCGGDGSKGFTLYVGDWLCHGDAVLYSKTQARTNCVRRACDVGVLSGQLRQQVPPA